MKKNNNQLKTLSVGITAYNEERNIASLLKSLLDQKSINYRLDTIFVYSDGSTDKTNILLEKMVKYSKKIKIHLGKKRRGKTHRLKSIYERSKSDILVSLDADIVIKDKSTLDRFVTYFLDDKVSLVYGNIFPTEPSNFFQKVVTSYELFWKDVIDLKGNGNNIHNCVGSFIGMKDDFYKRLVIPSGTVAEDHYIFLSAVKEGYEHVLAKEAIAYYKLAKSLPDYLKQCKRYFSSQDQIEADFGSFADKYYKVPTSIKIRAYIKSFLKYHIYMVMAIFLQIYQRISFRFSKNQGYLWEQIITTK